MLRLQQVILAEPSAAEKKESVQVAPSVEARLGLAAADDVAPVFNSEAEKAAARLTLEVIEEYETRRDLLPNSAALAKRRKRRHGSRWRSSRNTKPAAICCRIAPH